MSDQELDSAKRELLLAAVVDIQGSVKANDQKASAALVVHGLLFAGAVTVITKLGPAYKQAECWQRALGLVFLAIALFAFLVSVGYLLWAMSPYPPKRVAPKVEGRFKKVFFPRKEDIEKADPFGEWRRRVEELDSDDILNVLTAEILKLADVLDFESSKAKLGYRWLACELGFVAAFFVLVAGVVVSQA